MIDGKVYTYVINLPSKDVRNARRLARALENMVYPVFDSSSILAAGSAEKKRLKLAALDQADVLVIAAGSGAQSDDPELLTALDIMSKKGNGRVIVFGKSRLFPEEREEIEFIADKANGMGKLLRSITGIDEDTPENEKPTGYAPSEGRFSNMKSMLFILGFIAAVCIIFRIVVHFIK